MPWKMIAPSKVASPDTPSLENGAFGFSDTRSATLVPALPDFQVGSKKVRYAPRFFSLMINDVGSA